MFELGDRPRAASSQPVSTVWHFANPRRHRPWLASRKRDPSLG